MAVAGVGEVPPLIIPVDLGGGDWLEPVTCWEIMCGIW